MTSRSSFEYILGNNNEESNIPTSKEISIINVLHGLKHIRDVLNGSVKEFNPHILNLTNHNAFKQSKKDCIYCKHQFRNLLRKMLKFLNHHHHHFPHLHRRSQTKHHHNLHYYNNQTHLIQLAKNRV